MKKILTLFTVFALSFVLVGCTGKANKDSNKEGASTTPTESPADTDASNETFQTTPTNEAVKDFTVDNIAVTYVKAPLNVPSIVENNKGFLGKGYAEYNLPVVYSDLTTGPEQTQALASGDIQFLNAVGATSVILSASNGADIKIISMYSRSPKAFVMFSKDDSIDAPEKLKGLTVAGPKGTILHELLISYLNTAGLSEKDINFVSMDIPSSQAALAGGSVDIALAAGPVAYNMKKDGFHVVTDGTDLVDATIVVATSNDFYKKNPELVKKFLDVQKETLEYIEDNYEEIIEITAAETELPADAVKEMYDMYDFNMEIKDSDIKSMKKTTQFMLDNGMIENNVDIESLILNVK
jgi:sulfonate transport system substrate-binding protein